MWHSVAYHLSEATWGARPQCAGRGVQSQVGQAGPLCNLQTRNSPSSSAAGSHSTRSFPPPTATAGMGKLPSPLPPLVCFALPVSASGSEFADDSSGSESGNKKLLQAGE
jgi:hypothetical protein